MPLRPFSFINNREDSTNADRNWRTFDESSKLIVRNNLTMTSATSDPVIDYGYFTLYGPICFYNMKITLDTNDGWTTSSYISMPYAEFRAAGARQAGHLGQAFNGAAGTVRSQTYCSSATNGERLYFNTAYTNGTGAEEVIFVQGWFLRN